MGKFTGIRFYLREKQKWSNFLKLHAGFDASFVLDKTTDSANVSFICATEPSFLKINTWVVLFINADTNVVEFNSDGTPSNHEQFIVGGYQYYKTLAGYEVTMKLIEPIERFRGVLGETLSYTNQTSKEQNGTTYVKDAYNYYTALKRWLQVTPANTDNISRDSESKDPNGIAWWNRITILDKDFLSRLSFADDTLNELSLYDLLLDVYDSGTGRTPVAYFDIDNETKLARNNARDEYLLKFIVQDGTDKPTLEWNELVAHKPFGEVCTGVMKREDGANYATGLVANVTNLSPSAKSFFPVQGLYALPEALAEIRDTNREDLQWGLVLPYKIKKVTKLVEMSVNGYSHLKDIPDNNGNGHSIKTYDLSRNINTLEVLEQKEKDTKKNNDKINYYVEGDNIIYLVNYKFEDVGTNSAFHSQAPNNIASLVYYVEYEPIIDARIQVGDNEYVQQINQTASQVDSEKFGKFMQNYLDGMDKADYTIQRTTERPQDYINLIGSRVKRDNKTYIITNIAFRNRNLQYDVFFQLNENHLRKNMSYQAPQNIRPNTAIQYDNIQDRKSNYKMYFNMNLKGGLVNPITSFLAKKIMLNIFGARVSQEFYPQIANINCQGKVITASGEEGKYTNSFNVPVTPFFYAKQVCFNLTFLNNAVAIKKKIVQEGNSSSVEKVDQTHYITHNYYDPFNRVKEQIPVLYTDPFGEVEKITIAFYGSNESELDEINQKGVSNGEEFIKTRALQEAMSNSDYINGNLLFAILGLNWQKDMMENGNITIAVELKGNDGIEFDDRTIELTRLARLKEDITKIRLSFTFDNSDDIIYREFEPELIDGEKDTTLRYVKFDNNYSLVDYDYSDEPLPAIPNKISISHTYKSFGSTYIKTTEIDVDKSDLSDSRKESLKNSLTIYC